MAFSLQTHEFEVDPVTMTSRLVRANPYIRLSAQGGTPLYLQGGQVYDATGVLQKDMPEWFPAAFNAISDAALLEAGFGEPTVEAAANWTCDECGKVIPLRQKGVHIGRHVKHKKMMDRIP